MSANIEKFTLNKDTAFKLKEAGIIQESMFWVHIDGAKTFANSKQARPSQYMMSVVASAYTLQELAGALPLLMELIYNDPAMAAYNEEVIKEVIGDKEGSEARNAQIKTTFDVNFLAKMIIKAIESNKDNIAKFNKLLTKELKS